MQSFHTLSLSQGLSLLHIDIYTKQETPLSLSVQSFYGGSYCIRMID